MRAPLQYNRRTCLPVLAATVAGALSGKAVAAWVSRNTFVLVHGAWFGGWCWTGVADYLRCRGHRVFTPSLTGLGDRAHLAGQSVTLSTHVDDVIDVIDAEELKDVILVGHSYAGVPCAMVAERISDRIRQLVFLDSVLPEDGKPLSTLSSSKVWEARIAAARATPANAFPPPPIVAFGVTDAVQVGWLERQLRPQPIGTYLEAPHLTKPVGAGLDTIYLSCEAPAMAAIDPFRARARQQQGWCFQAIPSSHACMVTAPELTGETLERLAP